jgi:hypothetical protein
MLDTLERFGVVRGADRIDGRSVMEGLQVNGIGDEFVEPAVARSLMGDSSRAAQLLDEGAPAVRTFGERAASNPIYNGLLAQAMLRDGDVGDVVRVTDDIGHVADDVIRVADDVAPDLLARAVAIGSADEVARAVANLTPGRLMTLADGVTHALRLLR